ncbi:MAG: 4-hydroxythreonine-4-phosphate dehydrogenase PdxA [Geminicoccaceae bacterium]|nr:MAG: 4-hydroxythreonine-4-phosphate dehydrogenase PdxA [Geminicoccaceae bacterium]
MTPRVAITMGDPAGIGPEIILKAVARLRPRLARGELALLVVGSTASLRATAQALGLDDHDIADVTGTPSAAWPTLACLNVAAAGEPAVPGQWSAATGEVAYQAIREAVRLALAGDAAAIVTAPLSKEALSLAGHPFAGHTELLAELTGARDSVMMLAHGGFRVSHVTTHTALRDVPAKVTPGRIRRVVELTDAALRRLGILTPRIAVAALNPHAGEGGLFGREDLDVTAPTLEALRAEGYGVEGPVPGDTVFVKLKAGQFDAVIAMYHDQGHVPVKLLGFDVDPATGSFRALNGVNVTLGLPIIRTSVDHGTAFDIAGQGVANADSLIEAVDYALQLAKAPRAA